MQKPPTIKIVLKIIKVIRRNCGNIYVTLFQQLLKLRRQVCEITHTNSSISDPEDMCEHFNNFFSTIVNQYIADQQFSSNFDKLTEMVNLRINNDDACSIPQLTEEEVCSYLRILT